MKLGKLIEIRKFRGDKEIIIRRNGIERRHYVWQIADDAELSASSIMREFYDPIHDRYGVVLYPSFNKNVKKLKYEAI